MYIQLISIVNNVSIVIIASSVSSVQYCKTELCKTKIVLSKKKKIDEYPGLHILMYSLKAAVW